MTLDDLPELKATLEDFANLSAELDEMIKTYASHGVRPLDELTMQNIELAKNTAANALKDG